MKSQGLAPLGGQLPYCDFKCQQDSVRGIQETREELADRREETWGGPWRRASSSRCPPPLEEDRSVCLLEMRHLSRMAWDPWRVTVQLSTGQTRLPVCSVCVLFLSQKEKLLDGADPVCPLPPLP